MSAHKLAYTLISTIHLYPWRPEMIMKWIWTFMDNPTWTPRNTFSKILPYVFLNKNSHICDPGDPATDSMDSGYCSRAGVMEGGWARGKTKIIICLSAQSFPVVGTHFLASFHASIFMYQFNVSTTLSWFWIQIHWGMHYLQQFHMKAEE